MDTNEIERKKEKKLDCSHWMCKIQKFTFGIDAPTFYMGYCPFFWMTWLALICFPIIFIVKPAIGLTRMIHKKIISYLESKNPFMPTDRDLWSLYWCLDIDDERLVGTMDMFDFRRSFSSKKNEKILKWIADNPKYIQDVKAGYDRHRETLRKIQEITAKPVLEKSVQKEPNKTLRKISAVTSLCGSIIFKIVIPVLIFTGVIAIGWISYHIGLFLSSIPLASWLQAFTIMGFVAVISLLFVLSSALFRNASLGKTAEKSLNLVKNGICWTGDALRLCCHFITDTVKITYKQECPMIIWGEETGKIVRRHDVDNKDN